MTVKELIALIEGATFIKNEEKAKWLAFIPKMNKDQLIKLAEIMLWGQEQKKKLQKEKEITVAGVQEIFTALNNNAISRTKKDVPKILEYENNEKEKKKLENLLKEIENA